MTWFYAEAGQQAGPVDDAQLQELRRSGTITSDTLVWREGMANWQPYREIAPALVGASSTPEMTGMAPVAVMAADQAACAECRGVFNVQDMIAYGTMHVCATCKPTFVQKLAEGAKLHTGALEYASISARLGAIILDGVIMWIVGVVLNLVGGLGFLGNRIEPGDQIPIMFFAIFFLQMAMAIAYEVVMIGKYGATLGKMACKIKVVTAEGEPVSYARALGRYFAKMLSYMICSIGFIMAFFDDEKRTLHDRICNTRVVIK